MSKSYREREAERKKRYYQEHRDLINARRRARRAHQKLAQRHQDDFDENIRQDTYNWLSFDYDSGHRRIVEEPQEKVEPESTPTPNLPVVIPRHPQVEPFLREMERSARQQIKSEKTWLVASVAAACYLVYSFFKRKK